MKLRKLCSLFLAVILSLSLVGCVNAEAFPDVAASLREEYGTETAVEALSESADSDGYTPEEVDEPSLVEVYTIEPEDIMQTDARPSVLEVYKKIPAYDGTPVYIVNDNKPWFYESEMNTNVFENYSALDSLGRCGEAYANICEELMPTEERGEIGMVKPSGWQTKNYGDLVDGNYLYNRCHLIAFMLAGENANEKNLITGTRYMNVEGMLPFEIMVGDYVKQTGNHVLYRVTPVFVDDELVARGVLMEACSVEDKGDGLQFCVFAYNVQPKIVIDYATGLSHLEGEEEVAEVHQYVLNTKSLKVHRPECESVSKMSEANKGTYEGYLNDLLKKGYTACGACQPE